MRKQKLSPEASKAKAIRDKKIAMTGHRKKRKRENERMGQRSDSDIHHTKDGKQVRVSINKNRGNFGKGTKSEGPSMIGQTWLNRRIKGPNAEGDPVKKKNGKGVKPYQAIDMADYNNRQQLYSDSLSANIATENIAKTIKSQSSGDWFEGTNIRGESVETGTINPNDKSPYRVSRKRGQSLRGLTGFGFSDEGDSNVDRALMSDNAADAVGAFFGFSDDKPKSKPISNNTGLYKNYSSVKGIGSSINELKRTDKSLGTSNKESHYRKKRKSGETAREYLKDTSITGFLTADHDDSVFGFNLPYRPKPKQEILPPLSKNKPTITKSIVKKKPRPKDTISKMPIGKLESKSTTPKKLKSRENMKMLTQTVMGTSGKREPAHQYKKRKGLSDEQMYRSFPGLKPSKTK